MADLSLLSKGLNRVLGDRQIRLANKTIIRSPLRIIIVTLTLFLSLTGAQAVWSGDNEIHFEIPPTTAHQVLNLFARQADIQLLYPYDLLKGLRLEGLSGKYTVDEGIEKLIAGTCLEVDTSTQENLILNAKNRGFWFMKNKSCKKTGAFSAISAAILAGVSAQSANAQSASSTPRTAALEEIIVTAQKREQNLQDVPISIAAFSDSQLQASGVTGTKDLQLVTPGLHLGRQAGGTILYLRGIGSPSTQSGNEASVATYVDGVYMASPNGGIFSFNNVDRIEVLKGPQGTLFGRNATGGLVHIITKTPAFDPSANISFSYDDYDTVETKFYGTTGLTENIAGDLAILFTEQGEGYGKNLATGNDVNKSRETSLRSKLLITPSDELKITLSGDYTTEKSSFALTRRMAEGRIAIDGVTTHTGDWQDINAKIDPFTDKERWGTSARIDYDAGDISIVNITAYRYNDMHNPFSQDSTPAGLADVDMTAKDAFFTNEFQVLSNTDSDLSWIVGAFYMDGTSKFDPLQLAGPVFGGTLQIITDQQTTSYALFGETNYKFNDNTSLTVGLRWTSDERELDGHVLFDGTQIDAARVDKKWNEPSWRLVLDHRLSEDVLLYASYNRGFKSGVFSTVNFTNPPANPEIVDAYEVGAKGTYLDGTLNASIAAFYYDYADLQLNRIQAGTSEIINAAEAEIHGAEVDITVIATDNLSIQLGASYVDGEYTSFPDGPVLTPDDVNGGNILNAGDLNGNRLSRTPKFTGRLGATFTLPTEVGEFGLTANLYYSGEYFWEADNRFKQGAYTVVNNEFYWLNPSATWKLRLFIRNLTDEEYSNYSESTGVGDQITAAPPRTIGFGVDISL